MSQTIDVFEYSSSTQSLEESKELIHNYFQKLKTPSPAIVQIDGKIKNQGPGLELLQHIIKHLILNQNLIKLKIKMLQLLI
ncbi:MAG: hypothetical protein ACMXYB_04045 [Candidatus Woesearchaeota archaeon]